MSYTNKKNPEVQVLMLKGAKGEKGDRGDDGVSGNYNQLDNLPTVNGNTIEGDLDVGFFGGLTTEEYNQLEDRIIEAEQSAQAVNDALTFKQEYGYTNYFLCYTTNIPQTCWFHPDIADWVDVGDENNKISGVNIFFDPESAQMTFDVRIRFKKAPLVEGGPDVTIKEALQSKGYSGSAWIPMFCIDATLGTRTYFTLFFPGYIKSKVVANASDGYIRTGWTNWRLYGDGVFSTYLNISTMWDTDTDTSTEIMINGVRHVPNGGDLTRYHGLTAEEIRDNMTQWAMDNEGRFRYKQSGYDKFDIANGEMDCSGLVWAALWYSSKIPLGVYSGTMESNIGTYVTHADAGEPLDISKMLPGDIIALSYAPRTVTFRNGTPSQNTVTETRKHTWMQHIMIYLGNDEFIHMASTKNDYFFPEGSRAGDESPYEPGLYLLSNNFEIGKGPFRFRGAANFKSVRHNVDGTMSRAYDRIVFRYFWDTPSYWIS